MAEAAQVPCRETPGYLDSRSFVFGTPRYLDTVAPRFVFASPGYLDTVAPRFIFGTSGYLDTVAPCFTFQTPGYLDNLLPSGLPQKGELSIEPTDLAPQAGVSELDVRRITPLYSANTEHMSSINRQVNPLCGPS